MRASASAIVALAGAALGATVAWPAEAGPAGGFVSQFAAHAAAAPAPRQPTQSNGAATHGQVRSLPGFGEVDEVQVRDDRRRRTTRTSCTGCWGPATIPLMTLL
jgi:hypothetical protein